MKHLVRICGLALLSLTASTVSAADRLQPFVLAYTSNGTLEAEVPKIRQALLGQQFQVLGEYSPFDGAHVIAVSDGALQQAAATGSSSAYAAAIHVAATRVGDELQVSYLNPDYMMAAYRQGAAPAGVAERLASALGAQQAFGTAEGRSAAELAKFHYMIGMEYFTDPYELASYKSTAAAVQAIDANLARQVGGAALVYKLAIPGSDQVLYGISRARVTDERANDRHILADTVDKDAALKTTAYLPYQMLVSGGEVRALHMRFRMAVYHPDLTMGTFGKLISSPGAIEELLRKVAGGETRRKFTF